MLEPQALWSGLGLGLLSPKVSLPIFIHHMWIGGHSCPFHLSVPHCTSLPISWSLPLLSVWMNVASWNPWLSDFYTVWFSDSYRCSLFGDLLVILVVAQGDKACLAYASILTGSLPFKFSLEIFLYSHSLFKRKNKSILSFFILRIKKPKKPSVPFW